MQAPVGIVLVDYHGEANTRECLDSLAKARGEFQIYVVQADFKKTALKDHPTKPRLISRSENRGFSWANNLGMKQAFKDGCEIVVLLNNDTIVRDDFLAPLVKDLTDPKVGIVSPLIYFYPGMEFHKTSYKDTERGKVVWYAGGVIDWDNVQAYHWGVDEVDHGQFKKAYQTDFATGCCMALTKNTVERIGFMDEDYFLYLEDVDWSVKAKKAGFKILFEPMSVIWHKNAGSTGGSGSEIHQYYQTRNRYKFGLKYAKLRTKLALIKEGFGLLTKGNRIQKKAVREWFKNGQA